MSYSPIEVSENRAEFFFFLIRATTPMTSQPKDAAANAVMWHVCNGESCIHAESDNVREGTNVVRHIPVDRRHLGSVV